MHYLKGTSVPFFFPFCNPAQRDDHLLTFAVEAFGDQKFSDALIAAEYVCRRFPEQAIPALLRARILEASYPALAAKAWYRAWFCDPENPTAQDAMLACWLKLGAHATVRDLGMMFLPGRFKAGTQASLLALLKQTNPPRSGACWNSANAIEAVVLDFAAGGNAECQLLLSDGQTDFRIAAKADGQGITIPLPATEGVWSIALVPPDGNAGRLLHGSPIVFTKPKSSIAQARQRKPDSHVDLIIPVYKGLSQVRACLDSVMASLPANRTAAELIVIDDASPEPELAEWLDSLAAQGKITLLRNRWNLGFIETVNRGMALHPARDVLLLNADTLVHGDWIDRLKSALYSAADIASVTPWSNNGEITSFPHIGKAALIPDLMQLQQIDQKAAELHSLGHTSDMALPVCCGFTLMMRRSVLQKIGSLDGAGLTRGYGEEVDWCLRATAAGYRHLAATDVFVAHSGTVSFGFEKTLRVKQNRAVLSARYPNYQDEYHACLNRDPLRDARAMLEASLTEAGSDWLAAATELRDESIRYGNALPEALASRSTRIAIWQHRSNSPYAKKILELARAIATQAAPLRLLVIGEVSEALWHTGVVDVLPSGRSDENHQLSDVTMLGLSGAQYVLHEANTVPPDGIRSKRINARFNPHAWLTHWLRHEQANIEMETTHP